MSIPNQWYYVKNNERCGPIDPGQLKQLADAGEIQRGSLVWRAGMADWVEAEQVKGLFPEPVQVAAVTAPPATGKTEPSPASSEGTAQTPQAVPYQPAVRQKKSGEIHPVALLLDWLHTKVTASMVDAGNRLFTTIGFWAIFFYIMLITIGSLVSALQTKLYWQLGFAIGVGILAFALQHPAIKMLKLLDRQKFELKVPRPFFDTVAVLAILTGVGILIGLTLYALKLGVYSPILTNIAIFIILIHMATVALSLPTKEDDLQEETPEDQTATAGEASALFGGLFVVLLRTVPVIFGVGISLLCLELLYGMIALRSAEESFFFFTTTAYTSLWMLYCLLLPAAAYLLSITLRAAGRFILLRI